MKISLIRQKKSHVFSSSKNTDNSLFCFDSILAFSFIFIILSIKILSYNLDLYLKFLIFLLHYLIIEFNFFINIVLPHPVSPIKIIYIYPIILYIIKTIFLKLSCVIIYSSLFIISSNYFLLFSFF